MKYSTILILTLLTFSTLMTGYIFNSKDMSTDNTNILDDTNSLIDRSSNTEAFQWKYIGEKTTPTYLRESSIPFVKPTNQIAVKPPASNPISISATPDITINFDGSVTISGTLQGSGGDAWDGETVRLVKNDTDTGDTRVTDASGVFSFVITYTSADIGYWTYSVAFDGNLPLRKAGDVTLDQSNRKDVIVKIRDPISFVVTVDNTNVGPSTNYTYTVTATAASGASTQGIIVSGQEVYGISGTITPGLVFNGNVLIGPGGTGSYSSYYGDTTHWGTGITQDTVGVSFSIVNANNFPLFNLEGGVPNGPTVTVTSSYTFNLKGFMNGSEILNPSTNYYRLNQSIYFVGNVSNNDPNALPADVLNAVSNKAWTASITGAGYGSGTVTGFTNTTGDFNFTLIFDLITFPDINSGSRNINVQVTVSGVPNIASNVANIGWIVKEDLGNLTVQDNINSTLLYYPGTTKSIRINGTVIDRNGQPAANVPITIQLTNNTKPGDPFNNTVATHLLTTSVTTNTLGAFEFTINNFIFTINYKILTINVTIGDVAGLVWTNIGKNLLTNETGSFKYFRFLSKSFQVSHDGTTGGLTTITSGNINVFNDTFEGYANTTNAYYNVSFQDEYGRLPLGFFFNATGIGFSIGFEVNATNQGIFIIYFANLTKGVTQPQMNQAGSTFIFTLDIAQNVAPLRDVRSETYILYGPDNVSPTIQSITSTGEGTGQPDDIIIKVKLNTITSPRHNIRNVTIYYRISDNINASEVNAVFSNPYIIANMSYNLVLDEYSFTVSFVGHGYWVQYYIIVFDKAGQGLAQDGTTMEPGYPGWDTSFTRNDTSAVDALRFGDLEILDPNSFQVVDAVTVNEIPLSQNTAIAKGQNVTIKLYLPPDNGIQDYANVTIFWEIYSYYPNGTFKQAAGLNSSLMTQVGLISTGDFAGTYLYSFKINGSLLDWFDRINYYFLIIDQAGNTATTGNILSLIDNAGYQPTQVADEITPEDPNASRELNFPTDGNRTSTTTTTKEVWNANETASVSYNITDTGTGIANISLTMFYYFANGTQLNVSSLLVQSGVILYPNGTILYLNNLTYFWLNGTQVNNTGTFVTINQFGSIYRLNFTMDFNGLENSTLVSWKIDVVDIAGNPLEVNPQGDVAKLGFIVKDPPPDVTTTTTPPPPDTTGVTVSTSQTVITSVTQDEFGNNVTVLITSDILVTLFPDNTQEKSNKEALFIVLGFTLVIGLLTLYYQRNNIKEIIQRRSRARKVQGTLRELTDEIKRLGADGQYRKAIKLVWEALERVSREIIQAPRAYNQTAQEFANYLSTVTIVDRETLLTLTNAFESARYGKDEPTHDEWDDAVKALDITVRTIIESGARVQIDEDDDFD